MVYGSALKGTFHLVLKSVLEGIPVQKTEQ